MKLNLLTIFALVIGTLLLLPASSVGYATDWFRIGAMETSYRETNTQDVEIAFNLLLDEILHQHDEASVITSYKDFNLMINDMRLGKLDACMASSLEMIDRLDEFYKDEYYAFTNNNSSVNQYYIITPKKYTAIDQLSHKTLALSRNSGVGKMFLEVYLLNHVHQTQDKYFDGVTYESNSHTALVNLIFGKHDVVMVSKNGYEVANRLNPSIENEVNIIGQSDEYLSSFIAISKQFPRHRLKRLAEMALHLHESEKGRHLLNTFHFDRFVKIKLDEMQSVVEMRDEYQQLVSLYASR